MDCVLGARARTGQRALSPTKAGVGPIAGQTEQPVALDEQLAAVRAGRLASMVWGCAV
ncbi:hypothetical protein GCM10010236_74400 [Streptomyces eurythermus]|nr:hypothetical protein GCM10010236_74400 [Streptomyces eurythermus]